MKAVGAIKRAGCIPAIPYLQSLVDFIDRMPIKLGPPPEKVTA
jgi:hypothetical protein